GVIPAKVAALTEGVLKSMFLTKLKIATMVLLLIAVLGGGAVGLTRQMRVAGQDKPPEERKVKRAKGREQPKVDQYVEAVKKDLERLQGTWEILSFEIPTGKLDLPKDKKFRTLTIEGNKATLRVRKQEIVMTWLI